MEVKKCTVCNIKVDKDNYKKMETYVRTVTTLLEKYILITRSLEMITIERN